MLLTNDDILAAIRDRISMEDLMKQLNITAPDPRDRRCVINHKIKIYYKFSELISDYISKNESVDMRDLQKFIGSRTPSGMSKQQIVRLSERIYNTCFKLQGA